VQKLETRWSPAQVIGGFGAGSTNAANRARPKATPRVDRAGDTHGRIRHDRIRHDRIDAATGELQRELILDPHTRLPIGVRQE